MRAISRTWIYVSLIFPVLAGSLKGDEFTLAILGAGVQSSEDAPFVSTDYQFLPGEYVYVTFQIGGFAVKSNAENELRSISLTYSLAVSDSHEIPLAEPVSGEIKTELTAEDKNWIPRRRASFLLPSFVSAGNFHIHIIAQDLIGKNATSKEIPFRIGGVHIQSAESIAVENLRFSRVENREDTLVIAAYRPGDTVYIAFDMAGFQLAAGNKYHVAYGLKVIRPDGKTFLDQANAAQLESSSFYPAQFVPGTLDVLTSANSQKGEYVVLLTVRDLIGNATATVRQAFTLE